MAKKIRRKLTIYILYAQYIDILSKSTIGTVRHEIGGIDDQDAIYKLTVAMEEANLLPIRILAKILGGRSENEGNTTTRNRSKI